ncbi:E3 ubiquitin-protein ligase TRIM47-like [Pagrus major]|uniref:E3 ubiquitin-protein ligase TRIM47-like n=1 Tax=Pagrus major TaxID=143350 RepID=UPI003CC8E06E
MAEQQQEHSIDLDQSQFCCSVRLDLLKEPVTIPCGHTYCKSCIEGCWDQEEQKGQYSCPNCRETFSQRPVLRRNNMLAEVVVKLKKTSTQQASPPAVVACAGPSDISCDFCSEPRPNKATMYCLACLASYCPTHLQPHYSVPVLKKHQLVSATIPLQEKMCTKHNKLMEIYCRTDKKCICYLCIIDEHKGHSTVSAAAERAEEQKQLTASQKKVQKREKEREKELNELIQALKEFKSCSETAVKTSDEIFDELISSIKQKRTLAKQLMKDQEKTAVAQAEELQLQLEDEITKLRRRDSELEQLSHMDDHIHFIQTFKSLSNSCENPAVRVGPFVRPKHSFKAVTDGVSKLRDDVDSLLNEKWPGISRTVSYIDVVMPPEPETREDVLRLSNRRRIVLLGKTRSGKSSLAKTIFGEELFKIGHNPNSETRECKAKCKSVNGRSITLIDTPGFFDTGRPEEELKPEIVRCITECAPGPHAFLIVLKQEKFTVQEQAVIQKIQENFSEEAFKYATVVFTHGDQLPEGKTIEDFVTMIKPLDDLVKKCGGRCHIVDNKYWKEKPKHEYRSNQHQVEELLKSIDKMVMENNGRCYTNEMLQKVEEMKKQEDKNMRQSPENVTGGLWIKLKRVLLTDF